ncbi:MAG TPA: porin, partial [Steroidobacteraceae bacterium]|nr:porin [Steroidobacteraceae bacterium]
MTDSNRRISHAALVAALLSSPAFAASDPAAIELHLNALQQALARQQEQLAQQQQEIAQLREQLQQANLAEQDAPRVTMTSARPTISSADGRSSATLRSVVQLDAANYSENADRGVADFRRGSVGATANRETAAARDLSNGAYFRRARFGFEGAVARDFTYRVITELGGSGTEGPARINDFWIGYTGFAPFTIQ